MSIGERKMRAASTFMFATCMLFALQSKANDVLLIMEVEDLRSSTENGLLTDAVYFIFHNGSFDIYDYGKPANEGLVWFANHGYVDRLQDRLYESSPGEWGWYKIPVFAPSWDGGTHEWNAPGPVVFPSETPYFSFVSRIYPSNDAFVANEDPKRYRIFDEEGNFLGPLIIDIYGSDMNDAGSASNNEANLIWLDRDPDERGDPTVVEPQGQPVRPHPGFNGSHRNPDGEPIRLMGSVNTFCHSTGAYCHDFDPQEIDFSEPGYPLFRIRISTRSDGFQGAWSGTYFDPNRAGEGFIFEFFEGEPLESVLYWFTYEPGETGRQMWLIGEGRRNESNTLVFDLYRTEGGSLADLKNPETVEKIFWGTAKLSAGGWHEAPECTRLRLYDIEPVDESIELQLEAGKFYNLSRLTPPLDGLAKYCARFSSINLLPF